MRPWASVQRQNIEDRCSPDFLLRVRHSAIAQLYPALMAVDLYAKGSILNHGTLTLNQIPFFTGIGDEGC